MFSAEELSSEASTQRSQPINTARPASESLESLDALEQLRALLLGADYEILYDLRQQLLDRERYSLHVADIISEALTLRAQQDDSLTDALSTTIESAVSHSVEINPNRLANALYPVMGPAIRKSIQEVLHQALDTFNYLLEQSLSVRSLAWRFDAWRTGRSYSEVVLLKTLVYQVEQVFLIHRETGLLLQHVVSPQAITKDPELISSMMTAIQDFIKDSFNVTNDTSLKTLHLDELTVLFNQGPHAVVAAVVRGNPPADLNRLLGEVNEQLHRQFIYPLKTFQGDGQAFKATQPVLERCLKTQLRLKKRFPWLAILALVTLVGAAAWWGYQYYQQQALVQQALTALRAEPGLVVVDFQNTQDGYQFEILKDPQARDPLSVIQPVQSLAAKAPALKVTTKPYLAMDSEFVLGRAKQVLQPPAEVQLELAANTLKVKGQSDLPWQQKLQQSWPLIAGIDALDLSEFTVEDTSAAQLDQQLRALITKIEALRFYFNSGSSVVSDAQAHGKQVLPLILELLETARSVGKIPQVSISGATDETGTEITNGRLAKERALAMRDYLLEQGLPASIIAIVKPDTGLRNERSIRYQVDLF